MRQSDSITLTLSSLTMGLNALLWIVLPAFVVLLDMCTTISGAETLLWPSFLLRTVHCLCLTILWTVKGARVWRTSGNTAGLNVRFYETVTELSLTLVSVKPCASPKTVRSDAEQSRCCCQGPANASQGGPFPEDPSKTSATSAKLGDSQVSAGKDPLYRQVCTFYIWLWPPVCSAVNACINMAAMPSYKLPL